MPILKRSSSMSITNHCALAAGDYEMPEPSLLMLQFLEWVVERPRTYDETMEAWRSSCPRLTVWEDALLGKFIAIRTESNRSEVFLTDRGRAVIDHEEREGQRLSA